MIATDQTATTTDVRQINLLDLLPDHDAIGRAISWQPTSAFPVMTADPDRDLVASVKRSGVLMPILATRGDTGPGEVTMHRVVDGRRRLEAARRAGLDEVPVRFITTEQAGALAMTIAANAMRSNNPVAELDAIMQLMDMGFDERQISEHTGIKIGTIRKRQKMFNLTMGLWDAWRAGRLSYSVAEAAAKLSREAQDALLQRSIANDEPITAKSVRDVRQVAVKSAHDAMPLDFLSAISRDDVDTADQDPIDAYKALVDACRAALARNPKSLPAPVRAMLDAIPG